MPYKRIQGSAYNCSVTKYDTDNLLISIMMAYIAHIPLAEYWIQYKSLHIPYTHKSKLYQLCHKLKVYYA